MRKSLRKYRPELTEHSALSLLKSKDKEIDKLRALVALQRIEIDKFFAEAQEDIETIEALTKELKLAENLLDDMQKIIEEQAKEIDRLNGELQKDGSNEI